MTTDFMMFFTSHSLPSWDGHLFSARCFVLSVRAIQKQMKIRMAARAIIIEEALATWIFTNGMLHGQFTSADALDYSLLKTIRMLVEGYEVQSRPMWQWQDAILGAFRVFRQLRAERCGTVHIDLEKHSIAFESEGE